MNIHITNISAYNQLSHYQYKIRRKAPISDIDLNNDNNSGPDQMNQYSEHMQKDGRLAPEKAEQKKPAYGPVVSYSRNIKLMKIKLVILSELVRREEVCREYKNNSGANPINKTRRNFDRRA